VATRRLIIDESFSVPSGGISPGEGSFVLFGSRKGPPRSWCKVSFVLKLPNPAASIEIGLGAESVVPDPTLDFITNRHQILSSFGMVFNAKVAQGGPYVIGPGESLCAIITGATPKDMLKITIYGVSGVDPDNVGMDTPFFTGA
jgi:hypothetical protein